MQMASGMTSDFESCGNYSKEAQSHGLNMEMGSCDGTIVCDLQTGQKDLMGKLSKSLPVTLLVL